jgi:hypothetical protein
VVSNNGGVLFNCGGRLANCAGVALEGSYLIFQAAQLRQNIIDFFQLTARIFLEIVDCSIERAVADLRAVRRGDGHQNAAVHEPRIHVTARHLRVLFAVALHLNLARRSAILLQEHRDGVGALERERLVVAAVADLVRNTCRRDLIIGVLFQKIRKPEQAWKAIDEYGLVEFEVNFFPIGRTGKRR